MFTLAKAIIASSALIYGAAKVQPASRHIKPFQCDPVFCQKLTGRGP